MLPGWKTELARLFLTLGLLGVAGLISGYVLPFLALGLTLYTVRVLFKLYKLQHWLLHDIATGPPPIATGIWGAIFDQIYVVLRRNSEERDQLQQSVSYLQESFSAIQDGVVMLDSHRTIQWCNSAAQRLLGLRLPQDTGQMLVNLVREPEFTEYLYNPSSAKHIKMRSPVNNALRLEIHAAIFNTKNYIIFVRDITALERLETIRQDFVANISHEMRTPLTVISGYLETMEGKLDLQWQKALTQMREQTWRMENLLRDLLLLSTLESMASGPDRAEQQLELRAILESLRENALATATGKREMTLACDPAIRILGDRLQLESIFSNLIFNSVKYTDDGGKIDVNFELNDRRGVFSIKDNGIGIDPVHIPRLTERFYRVDKGRSMERGGTGLGLAIVKHALPYFSADLQIQSEPGKGSTFTCSFPSDRFVLAQNEKRIVM